MPMGIGTGISSELIPGGADGGGGGGAPANARRLEDNTVRLLEDGTTRVLES